MDGHAVSLLHPLLITPFSTSLLENLKIYWSELGVNDANLALALSEQTLRRLPDFGAAEENEYTVRAVIAAGELLDDWLAAALELPRPSRALTAARAALLSGAVPDWPSAVFAPLGTADAALEHLRRTIAQPTPVPSPSVMPTQRIEPLWSRS